MNFNVSILGSNSAVAAYNRFPTAQVLQHHNQRYMIDCGEGTQFKLSQYGIKRSNLNHIFISHLHADHYLGLVGFISSLRLNGRTEDLHIYAPPYLERILDMQLKIDERINSFEYIFHPLRFGKSELIYENDLLEVYTIPLKHKIDCNGFLFKEKPKSRKIIAEKIAQYKIPYTKIDTIKKGANFTTASNEVILNETLTTEPEKAKSYAYCSDTMYSEAIVPIIKNADLLYHESTFLKAFEQKAIERYHSTTVQAATIAKKANVGKLLLGHFSARYKDLSPFLSEAQTVFNNSALAIEGKTFEI